MKISDNGLAFITREEGEVLHVYKDQVGYDTIGVGHLLRSGESYPNGITHDQAMELLRQDCEKCERAINDHVDIELTQNQFDALCSFVFNLGPGALENSTLLTKLNSGDYDGAANEFSKWCHAGGQVNQVILNRRKREAALFMAPDEQTVFIEQNDVMYKKPTDEV